jgi:hypothetical protein
MAVAVSYDVDYGSRNAVLTQLGVAAGLSATALGITAGETHPNWVQQLNVINTELGLPTYSSLDMSAFQTVVGAIVTALNTPVAAPPANTSPPVVTGTGAVGDNLTCAPGTWTNLPTFTYQWLRGGATIAGATGAVYALVGADSGTNVSCRVTGTNADGNASATSNAIAVA